MLWLTCIFFVLRGASCVSDLNTQTAERDLPQPAPTDTTDIPIDRVAIAVYNPVGVRKEPGQKTNTSEGETNYITPIYYGEKVEMIDTPYVKVGDREYMMIRLQDGTEGWVWEFLMEPYGRRAVMLEEAEIYRRPDFMTLRNDKFFPAQIVIVIEDPQNPGSYGDWLHVSSFKKDKKGWIRRKNNLTFDEQEVEVALFYYRANEAKTPEERRRKLGQLLDRDIAQNSAFRPMIERDFKATESEVDPETLAQENYGFTPSEKLFVTASEAWLYEQPEVVPNQGITQLSQNAVCEVIERGEWARVDDAEDYWYHVRYQESEGWIFGYFTSLRNL